MTQRRPKQPSSPKAGQEKDYFSFRLELMTKDSILLTALPPGPAIGQDFIKSELVQET
jgi:hypothetical protein